jgi:hypothetical protein
MKTNFITFPNDKIYLEWIAKNPNGFIINMRKNESPDYMVLHKASCHTIKHLNKNRGAKEGGFTEHEYKKVGAFDIDSLRKWVKNHGRSDGSFSKECGLCKPI